MIRAFGVFNNAVPEGNMAYGIPVPMTIIVNRQGVVDSKFLDEDYRQRYTAKNILTRRYGVTFQAAMNEAKTDRVRLVSSASDAAVRGGQRVALVLEIELKPGIHVYAPGIAGGYIPIDWKLEQSPVWTSSSVEYPESKLIRLDAIDETVPAYETKLRVTRDVQLAPQRILAQAAGETGEVIVRGSFRYQACDEKQCFIPETVPLEWKLKLESMVTERVPAEIQKRPAP